MRKHILALITIVLLSKSAFATEGMWLPYLLSQLNEKEMQDMGMKMSADDIYSVNQSSLKDAIVRFGRGCTGEMISDQGLLLTNHHCGYSRIADHSSVENDYLTDGFWAKTKEEELRNPGLTATFISRIEDVTGLALDSINSEMDEPKRQEIIARNIERIKEKLSKEEWEDIVVKPFFKGNKYIAFITITYTDIRFVGAPPSSVGKFGADTDNWMWPRHTGDFSIFRIYADKNNKPAEYSEENVPYQPAHHLSVSMKGVKEGDFSMVFGFPGKTNEYLSSFAVSQIINDLNPHKIKVRELALDIMDAKMRKDDATRIKYASKFAGVANYWKKWIGESEGIRTTKGVERKQAFEKEFMTRVNATPEWKKNYGNLLSDFEKLYAENKNNKLFNDLMSEIIFRNPEILYHARKFEKLVSLGLADKKDDYNTELEKRKKAVSGFFKGYDADLDKEIIASLLTYYVQTMEAAYIPDYITEINNKFKGDFNKAMSWVFDKSVFTDQSKSEALLNGKASKLSKTVQKDPLYKIVSSFLSIYRTKYGDALKSFYNQESLLMRTYMKAQMEVMSEKIYYPDANSTMRVSYGKVQGFKPKDGVTYDHISYADGILAKYIHGDYEFDLQDKLIELYKSQDYGQYADSNGKLPVCFLASNHTTGGNSGSPVINADGNFIGINFDRCWESTMSDINYDSSLCRNIVTDARYILFIIDKYAGAGHLIEEMTLVFPEVEVEKEVVETKE